MYFYHVDEEDDYQQAYQLDDVQYLFDEPKEEGNIDRDNSGTDIIYDMIYILVI